MKQSNDRCTKSRKNLELDETARYLEEDLSRDEANNYLYQNEQSSLGGGIITEKKYKMQFTNADGTVEHIEFHSDIRTRKFEPLSSLGSNKVPNSIVSTSKGFAANAETSLSVPKRVV